MAAFLCIILIGIPILAGLALAEIEFFARMRSYSNECERVPLFAQNQDFLDGFLDRIGLQNRFEVLCCCI